MKDKYEIVDFGDLRPGDKLVGSDGELTQITDVYDKHLPDKMYEIVMEDGEVVKASGEHLWYCETEIDKNNKDLYKQMAEVFFENNVISSHLEEDEYYELSEITTLFGESIANRVFIERVCHSLGYASYQIEKVKDGREFFSRIVYKYSYNNLIDFLHKMKSSVIDGEGYFYFGEVRTTDKIFEIISYDRDVFIPHIQNMTGESKN